MRHLQQVKVLLAAMVQVALALAVVVGVLDRLELQVQVTLFREYKWVVLDFAQPLQAQEFFMQGAGAVDQIAN